MPKEEKIRLREAFIEDKNEQKLFHLSQLPKKKELFEFIALTKNNSEWKRSKLRHCNEEDDITIDQTTSFEEMVFSKDEDTAPNRVIVMDNLMYEAFNSRDKEVNSTMTLLMTKLSHHNNISILLVCHELYSKGPNSVLLREQLTGIHLHSIANSRKAKNYVYNYLSDNIENSHYDELFKEHVLYIRDDAKSK